MVSVKVSGYMVVAGLIERYRNIMSRNTCVYLDIIAAIFTPVGTNRLLTFQSVVNQKCIIDLNEF